MFYELAIRHGLKKPFIHMIEAAESIPFDNAQVRTIPIDLTDLDSVDRAKKEVQSQIESIEKGSSPESPISIAFDLEALKSSGNTDQALLAGLFTEVSQIRSELRDLRRPGRPRPRPVPPETSEELISVLETVGENLLADLMRQTTSYSVSEDTVMLITSLSHEEDRKLETDLATFLRRYTGRTWKVDTVPF